MTKKTIGGIYENGTIQFHGTVKLGRKLPLRNRTRMRFTVELVDPDDPVLKTRGILRISKRLARQIIESPEFSVLNS